MDPRSIPDPYQIDLGLTLLSIMDRILIYPGSIPDRHQIDHASSQEFLLIDSWAQIDPGSISDRPRSSSVAPTPSSFLGNAQGRENRRQPNWQPDVTDQSLEQMEELLIGHIMTSL